MTVGPQLIDEFVLAKLVPDATLVSLIPNPDVMSQARVFAKTVPQADSASSQYYPAIVYQWMNSSNDGTAQGQYRVTITEDWYFSVIGRSQDSTAIAAIFARMDAILQRASFNGQSGRIGDTYRTASLNVPTASGDGIQYVRIGGRYRFVIEAGS